MSLKQWPTSRNRVSQTDWIRDWVMGPHVSHWLHPVLQKCWISPTICQAHTRTPSTYVYRHIHISVELRVALTALRGRPKGGFNGVPRCIPDIGEEPCNPRGCISSDRLSPPERRAWIWTGSSSRRSGGATD